MNRYSHRQFSLVLAIVGLLVSGQLVAFAGARQEPSVVTPRLVEAIAIPRQGAIIVTGQDFTPGGRVYIALYDRWGVRLHETRWVTASSETFGLNGSRDPALGYARGGTVSEVFGATAEVFGPNGSRDPARGYIPGTSGSETADDGFGPNGSRDPALLDVPDITSPDETANVCSATLMVRALDEARDVWSNMLDVEAGCD